MTKQPNAVSTFAFGPNEATTDTMPIRTVTIDGAPWFIATDVCKALGIDTTHVRRTVDGDEVNTAKLAGFRGVPPLIVSESGMYALTMRSNKPQAKRFRKWVTSVVLPAIRKDGAYIKDEEKVATGELAETELVLAAMVALQNKCARLTDRARGLEPAEETPELIAASDWVRSQGYRRFPMSDLIRLARHSAVLAATAGRDPERRVIKAKAIKTGRDYERVTLLHSPITLRRAADALGLFPANTQTR